jgi:hypothetical protein
LNLDGALVDDHDENDPAGVGDRGEALENLNAFEALGGAKPFRHRCHSVGTDRHADGDARKLQDLSV